VSAPKKLSPAEAMRAVREQAARDAMDEVKALSEADLDAELRAEGVDPAEAERQAQAAIEAALARVPGEDAEGAEPQHGFAVPAGTRTETQTGAEKERALRAKDGGRSGGGGADASKTAAHSMRRRWTVSGVLVVAAGAAIAVGITNGAQIVAALRGDVDAGPAPSADASASAPLPVAPTAPPEANRSLVLRRDALAACARADWAACRMGLDGARDVDPDGEKLPEVVAARRALSEAEPKPGPK
jgi:hypothetical protein